jgi:3-oxoacyl-[acyl-carrier-protein] synthase-3
MKVIESNINIKVLGTGLALPEVEPLSTKDILVKGNFAPDLDEKKLERFSQKIVKKYSFKQRYLSRDPSVEQTGPDAITTESLGLTACKEALEGNIKPELFVHGTTTTSRYTGSQAPAILGKLGINAPAFELKAGCSTSLASLYCALNLLASGHENVLVNCCETLSKVIHPDIKETWFGLADGGAALFLEKQERSKADFVVKKMFYSTAGVHVDAYTTIGQLPPNQIDMQAKNYYLQGDGEVLKVLAHEHYSKMFDLLFPNSKGLEDIKWFIPHQVNKGLVDQIMNEQKLACELIWDADLIGNIGGSSILYSLGKAIKGQRFSSGDQILMMSVGGGLSFAAQIWEKL